MARVSAWLNANLSRHRSRMLIIVLMVALLVPGLRASMLNNIAAVHIAHVALGSGQPEQHLKRASEMVRLSKRVQPDGDIAARLDAQISLSSCRYLGEPCEAQSVIAPANRDSLLWFLAGLGAFEADDMLSAVEHWKKVPNADLYVANLGNIAYRAGEVDRALDLYKMSLDIDDSPKPLKASMYLNLCKRERLSGNPSAMLAWCQLASDANPSAWSLYYLGRAFMGNKQYSQAIDAFQRAGELAPELYVIPNALAQAYLSDGRADLAIESYKEAISVAPDQPDAYAALALLYLDTADREGAEATYRQAIAEVSDVKAREEFLVQLDNLRSEMDE